MILLNARTSPMRDYRGNMADNTIIGEAEAQAVVIGLTVAKQNGLLTEAEWRTEVIDVLMRSVPTEFVVALLADLLLDEVTR